MFLYVQKCQEYKKYIFFTWLHLFLVVFLGPHPPAFFLWNGSFFSSNIHSDNVVQQFTKSYKRFTKQVNNNVCWEVAHLALKHLAFSIQSIQSHAHPFSTDYALRHSQGNLAWCLKASLPPPPKFIFNL